MRRRWQRPRNVGQVRDAHPAYVSGPLVIGWPLLPTPASQPGGYAPRLEQSYPVLGPYLAIMGFRAQWNVKPG
ncbi:MAG: hypothetical protein PHW74_14100 [Desulfobacca sp.]|nr:hypothetical protein [Desulfobacca sp.]